MCIFFSEIPKKNESIQELNSFHSFFIIFNVSYYSCEGNKRYHIFITIIALISIKHIFNCINQKNLFQIN